MTPVNLWSQYPVIRCDTVHVVRNLGFFSVPVRVHKYSGLEDLPIDQSTSSVPNKTYTKFMFYPHDMLFIPLCNILKTMYDFQLPQFSIKADPTDV